jgi:hypothetical protein
MNTRLYGLFIAIPLAMPVMGLAQQPQQAALYKQAAQSYYNAAAQESNPATASCDRAWGDYYMCLANQLVSSGATVTCTPPTCQPGSGQGAAPSTYSVNGQGTSQSQFNNAVQQSLAPVPVIQSPLSGQQNAAQAVGNAVGTIANVLMQQEQEKEQRAEDYANEQAKVAASSGDFVDRVKAMRADTDYPQFLSDYASANNGASFTTDPDPLTDSSLDPDERTQIHHALSIEGSRYGEWKFAPIFTIDNLSYGNSLSLDEVLSQIYGILNVHIYVDINMDPAVDGTQNHQVNSIDATGLCYSLACDIPASSSVLNGGRYANTGKFINTDSIAWKNVDVTNIKVTAHQNTNGHSNSELYYNCRYAVEIPAKGLTAYHTRLIESNGDNLNVPPQCQFSGEPNLTNNPPNREQKSSGIYLVLDSKVAAEHLIGLLARVAQLAGGTTSATGTSAPPAAPK